MQIRKIYYDKKFENQFSLLPLEIKKKAIKARNLLLENPFHPSLRLHKLKGKLREFWAISLDLKYRIIFKTLENGIILFVSIGLHAIYYD